MFKHFMKYIVLVIFLLFFAEIRSHSFEKNQNVDCELIKTNDLNNRTGNESSGYSFSPVTYNLDSLQSRLNDSRRLIAVSTEQKLFESEIATYRSIEDLSKTMSDYSVGVRGGEVNTEIVASDGGNTYQYLTSNWDFDGALIINGGWNDILRIGAPLSQIASFLIGLPEDIETLNLVEIDIIRVEESNLSFSKEGYEFTIYTPQFPYGYGKVDYIHVVFDEDRKIRSLYIKTMSEGSSIEQEILRGRISDKGIPFWEIINPIGLASPVPPATVTSYSYRW